jgi:hypothetical protein
MLMTAVTELASERSIGANSADTSLRNSAESSRGCSLSLIILLVVLMSCVITCHHP